LEFRRVLFRSYLTSDLSWDTHVNFICAKANQALGFVRRQLGKCSKEVKLKAYTSLVRPHLEYASCAWDPHSDVHIDQIEMVQRRAARFILNKYDRLDSVTEMLTELKLDNLSNHRENARLGMLYKINRSLTRLITPHELQLKPVQRRNDNGYCYEHFTCYSDPLFSSYYHRTIRDLNFLNLSLVSHSSLNL